MNKQQYKKHHEKFTHEMSEITIAKNADYAGLNDDAFANFRMAQKLNFMSAEEGLILRMMDKMSRLMTFTKRGKLAVSTESVHYSCIDLANYAAILSGMAKDRADATQQTSYTQTSTDHPGFARDIDPDLVNHV